ncbi:MAG: carboxypeptidase-like regulatory domain-containing protein [Gemmatimonadales bacterium]
MMPRCLHGVLVFTAPLCAGLLLPWCGAFAQQRVIRVMGDDGQPVAFANVTLTGERPKITNERGEVEIGPAARAALAVDVRRLGYEPWYGSITVGDTVMSVQVTLRRISRRMFTVKITDSSYGVPAYLRGFYERMLARQRGIGNGLYLTPEELDTRNAGMASALLQGLNGVSLRHTSTGKIVAMSVGGSCEMTVLIDGHRACPASGCDSRAPSSQAPAQTTSRRGRSVAATPPPSDDQFVLLDNLLGANEIAAIEVYPRGASIPQSLPAGSDVSCGLIAFWTGARKAP